MRAIPAAANQGMTSVSSSRSLPAKSGRKTSGPSAAPKSAPKRTYEMARARFSGGVHVRRGRTREQDAAVHRPHPDEARDHQKGVVRQAAERREGAAERSHSEATGDDRRAPKPIHQPPRGERRSSTRRQEDRGPQAEDRLDPGHEHERDRRDRDRELQDPGQDDETGREEERVTPDGIRRHCRAIQSARPGTPGLRRARGAGRKAAPPSALSATLPTAITRRSTATLGERDAGRNLLPRGRAVRARGARVRRHDVPEEDVLLEPELAEHALHNGGRRLRGPAATELPLGRKRDAGDASAAISGSLADEENAGLAPVLQIGDPGALEALPREARRGTG